MSDRAGPPDYAGMLLRDIPPCTCPNCRPPAPPLSPAEAATVVRFENGEPAPESIVERVAVALADEDCEDLDLLDQRRDPKANTYRRLAAVAVDVMRGQA